MSYSYESLAIDKSKVNYLQKCFYLINLIKAKSPELWEKYREQYARTKPDESWAFFQELVEEYKKLSTGPAPAPKKKGKLKIVASESKTEKKKVVKKAAPKKKAPAKKAPAKKKAAKKAAPKKKAPAKKPAKKK